MYKEETSLKCFTVWAAGAYATADKFSFRQFSLSPDRFFCLSSVPKDSYSTGKACPFTLSWFGLTWLSEFSMDLTLSNYGTCIYIPPPPNPPHLQHQRHNLSRAQRNVLLYCHNLSSLPLVWARGTVHVLWRPEGPRERRMILWMHELHLTAPRWCLPRDSHLRAEL